MPVKEYRVRYWHQDGDGREDYMEFDTMEQAQQFYDSLDRKAVIGKWNPEKREYEAVAYPEFEF